MRDISPKKTTPGFFYNLRKIGNRYHENDAVKNISNRNTLYYLDRIIELFKSSTTYTNVKSEVIK